VTWVSPKAADLSYLVGFCEVDRNRRDASVDPLETAVRLEPLTPMWRLELAGSLTSVQRFDDAAREIEIVLAQTDDRCILGGAWRRKGFLEIERGQLAQAELSYRKSLEYEPGNHIALSELSVILQQRVKRGDAPAGETYTPPPSTAPTQSSCPRR
jgi:Flp pilus assembly protein TadD